MPELPEVETITQDLSRTVVSKRIIQVTIHDKRIIRRYKPQQFKKNLNGRTILNVTRRGKAIIFSLSGGAYLIVQPMMTGQLIFGRGQSGKSKSKATKLTFELSNDSYLNYNDQRLFGRLTWTKNLSDMEFFKALGPEPFDKNLNLEWLQAQLKERQTPIKTLLMNQNFIAGIGNIYASEILFHSRIHPKRLARSLRPSEINRLRQEMIEVLTQAIRSLGTSMNTYRDANGREGNYMQQIKVYGRELEECYFCKTPIEKIVLSGRSTFFCKRCQT